MVQRVMTYCSTAFLSISETNRQKFERLEKRAAKIIFGEGYQREDRMFLLVWRYAEYAVC